MRASRLLGILLLGLSALLGTTPAHAADGEVIRQLHVDVVVGSDGSTHFTETIDYDFGGNERHGIIRLIPLWDDLPDGKRRLYDLRIGAVTVDDSPARVSVGEEGAFRTLTIGDPDRTLSGLHRYRIEFTITDALTVLTQADLADAPGVSPGDVELYWDFIGDGWNVPVQQGDAVVTGPAAALLTRCYFGTAGSTATCAMVGAGTSTRFGPVQLSARQALTGVVEFPRAAFTTVRPAHLVDQPARWVDQAAPTLPVAVVLWVLLTAWLIRRALQGRRTTASVPVHDFVVFEPPAKLPAAEMAVAWKGRFDGRVLTAALLDLAARGAVTLTPIKRKTLTVERRGGDVRMEQWEQRLLDAALSGKQSADVGKYNAKLAREVRSTQVALKALAVQRGQRNPKALAAKTPWIVGLVLGLFGGAAGAAVGSVLPLLFHPLAAIATALVIGCTVGAIITPRVETESSAQFLSEVQGFRKLLDTDAAAARREFAHRLGLPPAAIFATMLPYAVVYGVDEAWAGAFPELTQADLAPYGLAFVGTHAIHDGVSMTARALASAMTNPASSGSGASGGSSGGGGGGGGGGSW